MVAYSFKAQFVAPIVSGRKRQTIRANRKRHARPGEELQLYTGMRTKRCRLIGRAICIGAEGVTMALGSRDVVMLGIGLKLQLTLRSDLDDFAQRDGFDNWTAMKAFWRENHPDVDVFNGVRIVWDHFQPAAALDI